MRALYLVLAVAMTIALAPSGAKAWRDDGHIIVCHIALLELEPQVRAEVVRLIALDNSTQTFEDACIWPDDVKYTTHRETEPWHYMSVARDDAVVDMRDCPAERGCLLSAIELHVGVLADPASTDNDRLEALKYLGHWIGDLHQPLHVGYMTGRGGNDNHVFWQGAATPISPFLLNPRETNMHRVWDHEMLDDLRLQPFRYATRLWMSLTDNERGAWAGMDAVIWAQESRDIGTAIETQYFPVDPGGPAPEPLVLGPEYLQQHWPTVELRLKQAGVRLAHMLNRLLVKQ